MKTYELDLLENTTTNMSISDGYVEAVDQNHDVLTSKQFRGRNFPCPNTKCILTFPTEELMKRHLNEEEHVATDQVEVHSTLDKVKQAWVVGLGGKVALRKTNLQSTFTII